MADGTQETSHVWLVMLKAMRALTRYAAAGIEGTGLYDSDFRVLEVLLHKGPLPVNTIGPIVDLTPGSISIAVDCSVAKGLVGAESRAAEDRRVLDRHPHPARKGPHCSSLPKACRTDERRLS